MEHKLSATVLKLEGDLIRIYIHERDLLCLLPLQNIYLNDGSLAGSLLKIRDKLDIIYSDGQFKGILSEIESTIGIIIEVKDTYATIKDQEGNQHDVPIQEIYNTSDRVIMKGARVKIQEVKRQLRRCSYIYDSISPINPVKLIELPLLIPNLYGGPTQNLATDISPGKEDQAENITVPSQSPTPSDIKYIQGMSKHYKIAQPLEYPNNTIKPQNLCIKPLPSISIIQDKLSSNPPTRDSRSDLDISTDGRLAPLVLDSTGKGNQEITNIPNIPKSLSQDRDTCVFCNQIRNEDEFYTDKICKCNMCLSCYYEHQSFTTCKKCYEPLSMQKMSTCKTCREKKLARYIITLECNHEYCKECLKDHIQIELSRRNRHASCPNHNCDQLISIDIRNQIIQPDYGQDDKSIKVSEVSSSNPHGRSICNICNSSDAIAFITRLDCNHLICTDCLKEYLEYKITHDLLNWKGVECCICDFRISDDVIKSVLDQGAYNQYISKMGILFNMKVKCPKKHITVAHRKHNECDVCKIKFCIVCKRDPHEGICERRNFWGRKYKDSCPECNKRNRKAYKSYKEYVICKNPDCNTSYCRLCYQRYSPILAHGPIYHKYDCLFHRHSHNKPSYNPIQCEDCKKLGVLCPGPY